jgi:hypothetical protein
MHVWCGRAYVLFMLWGTATAMLIHNTGLPLGVLYSFLIVMVGLTVGWIIIEIYKDNMNKLAVDAVAAEYSGKSMPTDLGAAINKAKGKIANSRTWKERFFSLKALHGMVMFTSWMNITGRIFASNQSGDFHCYTYPVYKPVDFPSFSSSPSKGMNYANDALHIVPLEDPKYDRLPWANREGTWAVMLSVGPMAAAAIVGLIVSISASKAPSGVSVRDGEKSNTLELKVSA